MSVHSGTGFAPFELANGWLPLTPMSAVMQKNIQEANVIETEEFLKKVHTNWEIAR